MSVFDDMRVFMAVIERGSFSEAGRTLRMSPALVSNRIARLESHLETRLFIRTTRKVTSTDAGLRYYEDCLDIARRVEEAETRIAENDQSTKGVLKITSSTSFGHDFLSHIIPEFTNRFPNIRLQYQITDAITDLLADGLDLSVRIGPLIDSSLKSRILAKSTRYIFASPAYFEKHGTPKKPNDLVHHNCLMLRFPGSRQFRWRFTNKKGVYELAVAGNMDSNNSAILTDWALAGSGLVLKTYWEVEKHVKAGKLKAVLTKHMPEDTYIAALYPYDTFVPPRVRMFIDYLAEAVKKDNRFTEALPTGSIIK